MKKNEVLRTIKATASMIKSAISTGKPLTDAGVKATIAVLNEIVKLAEEADEADEIADLVSMLKDLPKAAKKAGGAPVGFDDKGLRDAKAMLKMAKKGAWYEMMDEVYFHSEALGGDEKYPWSA